MVSPAFHGILRRWDDLKGRSFLALSQRLFRRRWMRPCFEVAGKGNTRRALFVYLSSPFHVRSTSHPVFRFHQSALQARQIAEALSQAGFCVDVVDLRDEAFRPDRKYDLVLSHRVEDSGLEAAYGSGTLKVYFSSGMNHRSFNRNLRERVEYFSRRRGRVPSNIRWNDEKMPFLDRADAIVGFGNETVFDTWRKSFNGPCLGFNNYAFGNLVVPARDWQTARNNFLFLGSRASVDKGLDLALEAVQGLRHLELHACGGFKSDREFCREYKRELFGSSNVHPHGWIELGSSSFAPVLRRCGWLLLPTCSEGSPGSVCNASRLGLVPILTREACSDVVSHGFELADFRVETIRDCLIRCAALAPDEVRARSEKVMSFANEHYSEAAFSSRWNEIAATLMEMVCRKS